MEVVELCVGGDEVFGEVVLVGELGEGGIADQMGFEGLTINITWNSWTHRCRTSPEIWVQLVEKSRDDLT